jgi:hypothetical protein|uniref:Uncharacterized protein n=1 Tax=Acidicaldus sp. TaxID=1872105 RepID=A0A8J4H806_9PROT
MALVKSLDPDNTGAAASYWRIIHRQDFFPTGQIEITLAGYLDAPARRAGRAPLGQPLRYLLTPDDFPKNTDLHMISTGQLYSALKAKLAKAEKLARDGNPRRWPEVAGIAVNPALAGAGDA